MFRPKKFFVITYLLTFINYQATLCYKMKAPFLMNNSVKMTLENFNYTQTNMAQDLYYLNTFWIEMIFFNARFLFKRIFSNRDRQWDLDLIEFVSRDTNLGPWDWDWDWFSWDAWNWDKYRLDSPGTKISGTAKSQAFGPLGTHIGISWD